MQGAPKVPPVESGGSTFTNVTTDPASGGSAGSRPGKKPEDLGSGESPALGEEPSPAAKVKTIQKPVYYISEVLHEAKARHSETHKLLYAILIASRKLCHYFQAHKIVVVTSYPLRAILHNSNTMGNIAKWVAELAGFQLDFQPRHAIKSQVLADFVAEWTPTPSLPRGLDHGSAPHFQKPGLQCSPDPTRHSSLTGPHATKKLELVCSLLTLMANK
jgi:hypothetical protein